MSKYPKLFKYIIVLQQYWQNLFVYRMSFVVWRLRQFLSSFTALSVWSVVFANQKTAFGYAQDEMITYIFLVTVLYNIILSSSLNALSGEIYSGSMSTKLVKPINVFLSLGFQDLAHKILNFGFVILESLILYFIFKPSFIFPNQSYELIFIAWVALAALICFIINLLFGSIGFWSPDSWGPRFLFYIFLDFTAGKLYPLDILPNIIQKIVYLTPFPYMSYVQIQLLLGRLQPNQILPITLTMLAWTVGLILIFKLVWQKGLKNYTAMGQ
ncbi:ABC-2 family transporter protein [Patescibacteria group bacterium]|nr:ABC-2 family transporter protein [Patescibacteria group bacterium]